MLKCCRFHERGEGALLTSGAHSSPDALLVSAGGLGLFQARVLFVVSVVSGFCACMVLIPSYIVLQTDALVGWSLDQRSTAYMSTAFFAGQVVGYPLWGALSDARGRIFVMLLSCFLMLGTSLVCLLSQSLVTFCLLRALVGLSSGGAWIGQAALQVEYFAPQHRAIAFVVSQLAWFVGEMWTVLMALALDGMGWRVLAITWISWAALLVVAVAFALPEPPRYLLQRGDHAGAMEVLHKIAAVNGRTLGPKDVLEEPRERSGEGAAPSWKQFDRMLWLRLALLCCVWFGAAGSYYASVFAHYDLNIDNQYVTNLILTSVELPCYALMYCLIQSVGRRVSLIICFILSGASLMVVQFTNGNNDHLTLAFALTARFAATVLASVVWLAGAEIFPTSVRSFALGVGASAGRVGCIVFPLLVDWGFSAGYATASVLVLICGALTLLLQDMKGRDLSDSKPTGPEQPVPFKG